MHCALGRIPDAAPADEVGETALAPDGACPAECGASVVPETPVLKGASLILFSLTEDGYGVPCVLLAREKRHGWTKRGRRVYTDFGGALSAGDGRSAEALAAREFVEETLGAVQYFAGRDHDGGTRQGLDQLRETVQRSLEDGRYLARMQFKLNDGSVYVTFLKQVPWQPNVSCKFRRARKLLVRAMQASSTGPDAEVLAGAPRAASAAGPYAPASTAVDGVPGFDQATTTTTMHRPQFAGALTCDDLVRLADHPAVVLPESGPLSQPVDVLPEFLEKTDIEYFSLATLSYYMDTGTTHMRAPFHCLPYFRARLRAAVRAIERCLLRADLLRSPQPTLAYILPAKPAGARAHAGMGSGTAGTCIADTCMSGTNAADNRTAGTCMSGTNAAGTCIPDACTTRSSAAGIGAPDIGAPDISAPDIRAADISATGISAAGIGAAENSAPVISAAVFVAGAMPCASANPAAHVHTGANVRAAKRNSAVQAGALALEIPRALVDSQLHRPLVPGKHGRAVHESALWQRGHAARDAPGTWHSSAPTFPSRGTSAFVPSNGVPRSWHTARRPAREARFGAGPLRNVMERVLLDNKQRWRAGDDELQTRASASDNSTAWNRRPAARRLGFAARRSVANSAPVPAAAPVPVWSQLPANANGQASAHAAVPNWPVPVDRWPKEVRTARCTRHAPSWGASPAHGIMPQPLVHAAGQGDDACTARRKRQAEKWPSWRGSK
jgi:hypothetical protein